MKKEARERLSGFLRERYEFDSEMFEKGRKGEGRFQRIAIRPNSMNDGNKKLRDLWSEESSAVLEDGEGEYDTGGSLEERWGYKDITDMWGSGAGEGGWRWKGSGGPMMLLPKVRYAL